jgi:hypothetical protein
MSKDGDGVVLKIDRMPVSGLEYRLRLKPSGADSFDFEIEFTLHKKTRDKASFTAAWACYMSTFDEIALYSPTESADHPTWVAFGEREPFVVGDPVNYEHTQRSFPAPAPAFPAVYGRLGSRVLMLMASRPEVTFFVVNAGGHRFYSPVPHPAWDFRFTLPDYEVGKPFGFQGRLIYKVWDSPAEVVKRYKQWKQATGV